MFVLKLSGIQKVFKKWIGYILQWIECEQVEIKKRGEKKIEKYKIIEIISKVTKRNGERIKRKY